MASIAGSNTSAEILSQSPRVLRQVVGHWLEHHIRIGDVVASEGKEHPA